MKLLIIFFCSQLFASWEPQVDIPYELEVIIKNTNSNNPDKEYLDQLKQKLGNIFVTYSSLDKKEFYYIYKVTAYKYLLRESPEVRLPVNYYSTNYLNQFVRNSVPAHLEGVAIWIWRALARDVAIILRDPQYPTYSNSKKTNRPLGKLAGLDKKIRLILPWLIHLKINPKEEITPLINHHILEMLDHVTKKIRVYMQLKEISLKTGMTSFNLAPFIKIDEKKDTSKDQKDLKTLDNIVDQVTKENLPKPVDDWILESGEFLPENEVDNLPEPVDDWLNEY